MQTTCYLRSALISIGASSPLFPTKLPVELRPYMSACVPVADYGDGTLLLMLAFGWPLTSSIQFTIAASLAKLKADEAWSTKDALPSTSLSVIDAETAKPKQVTIKELAAKYRFVGEAVADVKAEPIEAESVVGEEKVSR